MADRSHTEYRDATDFLGRTVGVRAQSTVMEGRYKRWWCQIVDIVYLGRFVKVKGVKAFGSPRWVELKDCMWKTKRERLAAESWLKKLAPSGGEKVVAC